MIGKKEEIKVYFRQEEGVIFSNHLKGLNAPTEIIEIAIKILEEDVNSKMKKHRINDLWCLLIPVAIVLIVIGIVYIPYPYSIIAICVGIIFFFPVYTIVKGTQFKNEVQKAVLKMDQKTEGILRLIPKYANKTMEKKTRRSLQKFLILFTVKVVPDRLEQWRMRQTQRIAVKDVQEDPLIKTDRIQINDNQQSDLSSQTNNQIPTNFAPPMQNSQTNLEKVDDHSNEHKE